MSDETAVWDFSGVSRAWQKQFMKTVREATQCQITLGRPVPDGGADVVNAHYDGQERALARFEELAEAQQALIAQVLVEIPRDWLSAGAPDEIDLSDAAQLDWILPDRYAEILQMVQTGAAWSDDSKN